MTESEVVARIKDLCTNLGQNDLIAQRAELPELFVHLGTIVEVQHTRIVQLESRIAKLVKRIDGLEEST